ncbi:MAG: TIGR00269 family protein [Thermoprotei archaeon]
MKVCKCGKSAFYYRAHTAETLCESHFVHSIEENVKRNINKNNLFTWNDKIMIAASGGKDSSVLLYILSKIEKNYPAADLFAVTIIEGIPQYSENREKIVKEVINIATNDGGRKIEHYVFHFKKEYGYTLSEIVQEANKRKTGLNPCSYCGVMRRRLLNTVAKQLGATKVATGHNLDDEAQTILMNMGRNNIERLLRVGPKPIKDLPGFIPRVKPLRYVPENEITLYAYLKNMPSFEQECPYVELSLRGKLRKFLNDLEKTQPGFKYNLVKSVDNILEQIKPEVYQPSFIIETVNINNVIKEPQIKFCKRCGEPTSTGDLCRACELLEELGITT